ncbi:GIY-YIG nuclease family protein [candidate division KSB1 bacterium]
MPWFVYILKCSDDSFYIGQTSDLEKRIETHNAGNGPKYTAFRRPIKLVYSETFTSQDKAIKREKQIKKWSRLKKQALINGDLEQLKYLSKSRQTN